MVLRGAGTGDAVEVTEYYPEDAAFLLEFEPTVLHCIMKCPIPMPRPVELSGKLPTRASSNRIGE
jgi:hypothetical protein